MIIWKKYNNKYLVSNTGMVVSIKNQHEVGTVNKYGRCMIGNTIRSRMVAELFCDGWFDGCEVHHIDMNKLNDNANNLVCLTKFQHQRIHKENVITVKYDSKWNVVDVYNSIADAESSIGCNKGKSHIRQAIKLNRKCGGFYWKCFDNLPQYLIFADVSVADDKKRFLEWLHLEEVSLVA